MHPPFYRTLQTLIKGVNNSYPAPNQIVRIEIDCEPTLPVAWLLGQENCPRYYWAGRDRNFEMAGIGESNIIQPDSHEEIEDALSTIAAKTTSCHTPIKYFGGYRFYKSPKNDKRWNHFKPYRFVLPLLELCKNGNRYFWACNLNGNNKKESVLKFLEAHSSPSLNKRPDLPEFSGRTDLPDYSCWKEFIYKALSAISDNTLQKVVLARETTFQANASINPVELISKMHPSAKNLYLFCFEPAPGRAFLGASPERLYRRIGRQAESEALAGTRPRGNNDTENDRLEKELLASAKDRLEHQIVLDEVVSTLEGLCTTLQTPPGPEILKLMGCQHLHTPVSGILKENITDTMLLQSLHPTPAVGGFPKDKALKWLQQEEPFERGIYAAPVGWIGVDGAEFCVGIRSGLVSDRTLTLYSGAGIVKESDPEEEWRELNAKLTFFLNVIGRGS